MAEGIRVAWSSVLRRMGNEDGADLDAFLIYRDDACTGSPDAVVHDVESAVDAANSALSRAGEELVWAEATLPSVKGVMIQVRYVGTREQNRHWVQVLSTSLETSGRSGAIGLAPKAPRGLFQNLWPVPKVSGFAAYSVSEPPPVEGPLRWRVDPATTAAVCAHAVEWGTFPGADTYLGESTAVVLVDRPDVARPLAGAVQRFPQADVSYGMRKPPGYNRMSMGPSGQVCYQAHVAGTEWHDRVQHVLRAILRDPAALDLAFIRLHIGMANTWTALNAAQPELPYVTESDIRYNRELWDRYTPDAHAVQVLTRHHLDRAYDLTDWKITPLDGDRYLVQASDLAAWFAREVPDEATVEQARTDFGEMILRPAVLHS